MNTGEAVRQLAEVVRRKHPALATERTCCAWLTRYCDFLKGLPLHLPSQHKLERFLTVLAKKDVAASTQNQAFDAIIRNASVTAGHCRSAPVPGRSNVRTSAAPDKSRHRPVFD
jgi:hypothetical protein